MKLQVSFDLVDLEQALNIAYQVAPFADILEVGTLLLYHNGIVAVEKFKEKFPNIDILADTKIVDRGKDIVSLFAKAGADWVTVMAGTKKNVIHAACTTAHEKNIKIMLDLLDSPSIPQSALEAQNLGATALLFHQPIDVSDPLLIDKWEMVTGNASVPIFASGNISRANIHSFISMRPHGLVIGKGIIEQENPATETAYLKNLLEELK